jgi:hypothetical protein
MIRAYVYSLDEDDTVVSGGAKGADTFAEIYARERGLDVIIFKADWNRHGRRAGFLRNHDIVNECDRLVAFWSDSRGGKSTGTQHSIRLARDNDKPTLVLRPGA